MNKVNLVKFVGTLVSSLALVSVTHAATPGAYAGVGLGASTLRTPTDYMFAPQNVAGATSTDNSYERGGLGGKIFAGYNFNQYFGLEAGLAKYAQSKYQATANLSSSSDNATLKYNETALSLVGKGYLPVKDSGLDLYALAGLAETYNSVNMNNPNNIPTTGTATYSQGNTKFSKLRPTYGVGMNYNLSSQVVTGLEFSRIQGSGNLNTDAKAVPNADMLSLNVAYKFD